MKKGVHPVIITRDRHTRIHYKRAINGFISLNNLTYCDESQESKPRLKEG